MPAEINIPVRVQVLKDSINELQGLLSNLKIDSTSFKTIDKYIKDMTREMTQFEAMVSKPFGSQSQFNRANKSIEKMEMTLAKAKIAMDDIKFPEIKMSDSQQAQWDNLNQILDDAVKKFEEVKSKVKGNILADSDTQQLFQGLDDKYMTKSFDDLFTMIDRKTQQLGRKMADAKEKMAEFNGEKNAKLQRINALRTGGVSAESLGEVAFNRFFEEIGGKVQFKNIPGQGSLKQDFLDYLKKDMTLSDKDYKSLTTALGDNFSAAKLNKVFQNMSENNMFTRGLEASSFPEANKLHQAVQDLESAYMQYDAVLQKFKATVEPGEKGKAAGEVAAAAAILDDKREAVEEARDALMKEAIASTRSDPTNMNVLTKNQQILKSFTETLRQTNAEYVKLDNAQRTFTNMKMAISNFMGFYQVLNLTRRAVKDAMTHIKDLDSVMNKISIVTDMSTGDLWQQVDAYSKMAQRYGVSIKGAYEVSQIYYQQGLDQKEVLELTNETLKLSKISGLDYATTTDYMTTALRGFKMEASDAGRVVDVYSNLAAHTAVSQGELAIGMSKTASSLESVGSTFEESSAMISTMVAVTRESATNIGSAIKSIAARYGEMKTNPTAIEDIEGEAIAYNKVDAALQSVGISLKDTDGQFRNFTDVIIELGEKWDTLESTQQRYIATQFAGNRQQSRFLALVSNVDLLKSNLKYAENSEDVGDIQALKALDSIESKTEQLKVAYQQMYTTIGAEDIWKGALDGLTEFMNTLNGLPKLFDKIPLGAASMIYDVVNVIKTLSAHAISGMSQIILQSISGKDMAELGKRTMDAYQEGITSRSQENRDINRDIGKQTSNDIAQGSQEAQNDLQQPAGSPDMAKKAVESAQEISKEVEKQNQITIETNLSTADTTAQAQAAADQAKATMEENKPVIDINADTSKAFSAIDEIVNKVESANPTIHINADSPNINIDGVNNPNGPAKAAGNRQTLMGELGPELYVSNGKYYIAGANGPEMVGLPSDAIVFNHLQTEDLLKNQKTTTTGKPITNERKATAMASGYGYLDYDELVRRQKEELENIDKWYAENSRLRRLSYEIAEKTKAQVESGDFGGYHAWGANRFELAQERAQIANLNPGLFDWAAHEHVTRPTDVSPMLQRFFDAHPEVKQREQENLDWYLKENSDAVWAVRQKLKAMDAMDRSTSSTRDQSHEEQQPSKKDDPMSILRELQAIPSVKDVKEQAERKSPEDNGIIEDKSPITKKEQQAMIAAYELNQKEIQERTSKAEQKYEQERAEREQKEPEQINQPYEIEAGIASKVRSRSTTRDNLEEEQEKLNALQDKQNELLAKRDALPASQQQAIDDLNQQWDDTIATRKSDWLNGAGLWKSASEKSAKLTQIEEKGNKERDVALNNLQAQQKIETEQLNKEIAINERAITSQEKVVSKQESLVQDQTESDWERYEADKEKAEAYKTTEGGLYDQAWEADSKNQKAKEARNLEADKQAFEEGEYERLEDIATLGKLRVDMREMGINPNTLSAQNENISVEVPVAGKAETGTGAAAAKEIEKEAESVQAEVPINVKPDQDQAEEEITQTTEQINEETEKNNISIENEEQKLVENEQTVSDAMEKAKALSQQHMHSWDDLKASFDVDTSNAEGKLDNVGNKAEDTKNKIKEPTELNVDTSHAESKLDKIKSKLSWKGDTKLGGTLTSLGSGFNMLAGVIKGTDSAANSLKGTLMGIGGIAKVIGGVMSGSPMAIITGIISVINTIDTLYEDDTERLERLTKEAEELNNKAKQAKSEYREIKTAKEEYDELDSKRYDSAEAAEKYQEKVEDLTTKFPGLIQGFDEAGNAILNASAMEDQLTSARQESAAAALEASSAELEKLKQEKKVKLQEAVKAGQRLTNVNIDTGEDEGVSSDTYYSHLAGKVVDAMPEWLNMSWENPGDFSNLLYNDIVGTEHNHDPLTRLGLFIQSMQGRDKIQLGVDSTKQDAVYKLYNETMAPYFDDTDWDWSGMLKGFREISKKAAAGDQIASEEYSVEFVDMLKLLEAVLGTDEQVQEAKKNNGSSTVLLQRVNEIENTALKERLSDAEKPLDDISIINEAINAYNAALETGETGVINDAYKYMQAVIDETRKQEKYGTAYLMPRLNELQKAMEDTGTALQELNNIDKSIDTQNKTTVSTWLNQKYGTKDFMEDVSGLSSVISDSVFKTYDTAETKKELKDWLETEGLSTSVDLVDEAEEFWTGLGDENKELFTKMLKNNKDYSDEEIFEVFKDLDPTSDLGLAITGYYSKIKDDVQKRITKQLSSEEAKRAKIDKVFDEDDLGKIDTVAEERYFNSVLENTNYLAEHGYETAAKDYREKTSKLFDSIEGVSAQTRSKILSLLYENGMNTKEGFTKTIDSIKADEDIPNEDKEQLLTSLKDTKEALLSNLRLELQVSTDTFLEKWKEGSKTLSKLSSGIDLEDVNALIQSDAGKAMNKGAGLSLDDFMMDGDKLVLQESQADEYITQYFAKEREKLQAYQDTISKTLEDASWLAHDKNGQITGINHTGMWTEEEIQEVYQMSGIDIADYAKKNRNGKWIVTPKKRDEFNKAVLKGIEDTSNGLQANYDYLTWAQESITKTRQWNKGDYSSLEDIYKQFSTFQTLTEEEVTRATQKRLKYLVAGTRRMTDKELEQPDIKNAVEQIRSAYGDYISDLINEDINSLYAQDYLKTGRGEDTIKKELKKAQQMVSENKNAQEYAQWIVTLSQAAGQTLTAQNDNFVNAFNRIQQQKTLNGVQDIQFLDDKYFAATTDELKNFAETYQLNINEMVSKGLTSYDDVMGKWIVNYTSLDQMGLDLTTINGFRETVTDSVNNFFDKFVSTIQNALSGGISNIEAKELQEQAMRMGLKDELDFTQTTEGLKLTETSLFKLYSTIKSVDSISAKKLLPQIKEVSKEYGNLSDATKALADAQKSQNKEKAEALADLVGKYLRESAEAYNGEIEVPTEWQKAGNYYTSVYEAEQNIKQSKSSGYQDYTSFYQYMKTIDNRTPDAKVWNGLTASEILDMAPEFFEVTDKGLQIDLMGMGWNNKDYDNYFTLYKDAREMDREEGAGYERLAQSLNVGSKKGKLDISGAYDDNGRVNADKLKTVVEQNKDLQQAFSAIELSGRNLNDIIQNNELGNYMNEDMIDRFIKAFSETNFEPENFDEQFSTLFGENADNIQVKYDTKNGKVDFVYNFDKNQGNITPKYQIGDQDVSPETFAEWSWGLAQEGASASDNGTIKTINFKAGKYDVTETVDAEGHTVFNFTGDSGRKYKADTHEDFQAALDDEALLSGEAVAESKSSKPYAHYTYEAGEIEYSVTYAAGKITVINTETQKEDSAKAEELQKKISEQYRSILSKGTNIQIDAGNNVTATVDNVPVKLNAAQLSTLGDEAFTALQEKAANQNVEIPVSATDTGVASVVDEVLHQLGRLPSSKNIPITLSKVKGSTQATGNVALSKGTLMGELGPELWVSGGHYYVAGQNGAEFVNLPDDAIVFNHLQTKRLLGTGTTSRGKPVTNESIAAGEAHGYTDVEIKKQIESKTWSIKTFTKTAQEQKAEAQQYKNAVQQLVSSDAPEHLISGLENISDNLNTQAQENLRVVGKLVHEINDLDKQTDEGKEREAAAKEYATGIMNSIMKKANTQDVIDTEVETIKQDLKDTTDYVSTLTKDDLKLTPNAISDEIDKLKKYREEKINDATGWGYTEEQIKQLTDPIDEVLKSLSKQEKSLTKTTSNMENASNNLSQVSDSLQMPTEVATNNITSNKRTFVTDENLLHTGFKRKEGFKENTGNGERQGRVAWHRQFGSNLILGNSYDLVGGRKKGSGSGNNESDQKEEAELKKLYGTVIDNLLSQGFENIDLSDAAYEKIPSEVRAEMQSLISDRATSTARDAYRNFVLAYADGADMSTSDFNAKYFEAWQKDEYNPGASEEVLSAMDNLTFYASGKIAASAEEWTTLFGDATDVSELFEAGIIDWDEDLRQYVVTNLEALQEFDTNLDAVKNLQAIRADSLLENYKTLQSNYESALSGTLSNMEAVNFKHLLEMNGIDVENLEFTQTAEGLQIAGQSAFELYKTLAGINGLQANVTFDKLKENLEETNKHYKDMESIILRIRELESETDPTKRKQYEAELAVAKQIREARIGTEDESYSKMGKGMEGGIKNPLNLLNDVMQITNSMREGTASTEDFYNTLERFNATAKIDNTVVTLGDITLDGTEESLTKAYQKAMKAVKVSESGDIQIEWNALGVTEDSLKDNTDKVVDQFITYREDAIATLQRTIPRAAIREALTDIGVEDGYGDGEILNGTKYAEKFKADAQKLLAMAASDTRLATSLAATKVGNQTLYDVLVDAQNSATAQVTLEEITQALAEITEYDADNADLLERQKMLWDSMDLDAIKDDLKEMLDVTTAYVGQIEKWFNYLHHMSELEQQITFEEKKRSEIQDRYTNRNAEAYVASQAKSLKMYEEQRDLAYEQLDLLKADSLKEWQNMVSKGWGQFFSYDTTSGEIGLLGNLNEQLRDIFNVDTATGMPNFNKASEQIAQLLEVSGLTEEQFNQLSMYSASGEKLVRGDMSQEEYDKARLQNFLENYNAQIDIAGDIDKSMSDAANTIVESQSQVSKELNEIRDNQIEIENKVMKAVEDLRQTEIDNLKDEKDAYKEQTSKYINGLKDALSAERKQRERTQGENELTKLQRQLSILQRSGGSAAEIASLQEQISDKQWDNYSREFETQIDAIQEASDLEVERLDNQIKLMEETLKYEKEYGLLWDDVYEVMSKSPDEIMDFIQKNTKTELKDSVLAAEKDALETRFEINKWKLWVTQDEYTKLYNKLETLLAPKEDSNPKEDDINWNHKDEIADEVAQNAAETVAGEWKSDENGWWYEHADGTYSQNAWEQIDGTWYRFDDKGYVKTGWFKNDAGEWYYLSEKDVISDHGGEMHTGWMQDSNGEWYYLDPDAKGPNGEDKTGRMATGWFQNEADEWYYADTTGAIVTGEQEIDGKIYNFETEGDKLGRLIGEVKPEVTETIEEIAEDLVDAVDKKIGQWIQEEDTGRWWYKHNDDSYTKDDWEKINDQWYHFDDKGWMQTGWLQDTNAEGNPWYYLQDSGAMKTGWLNQNDKWYYLDPTKGGAMATGWFQNSIGDWYYANALGEMLTGTQEINGKTYNFETEGENMGRWIPDSTEETEPISTENTVVSTSYVSNNDGTHSIVWNMSSGYPIIKGSENCSYNKNGICTKCKHSKNHVPINEDNPKKEAHTYDSGGIVDGDQFAFIHDAEAVFTPEQTSILRNKILSNKPTSLLSLLTTFTDAYNHLPAASAYDSIGGSNGIIIENATVEMNVASIANDYDAQRAGEQALDKMLQIARKTSANNRIGR